MTTEPDLISTTPADSELVTQVLAGEIDVFESIMRRHNQRLYRIARSIVREDSEAIDVVQEAYVKAYSQLHTFVGPEGFISWLSRIANNEALMRIRKSKYIEYSLDDLESGDVTMESSSLQPMDAIANEQLSKLLEGAIDTLSVEYRSVYVMRAVQNLSTLETAESLSLSEDVVKTRYLRAKRALKKIFQRYLETSEMDVFEFAGSRCDQIVQAVLDRIH